VISFSDGADEEVSFDGQDWVSPTIVIQESSTPNPTVVLSNETNDILPIKELIFNSTQPITATLSTSIGFAVSVVAGQINLSIAQAPRITFGDCSGDETELTLGDIASSLYFINHSSIPLSIGKLTLNLANDLTAVTLGEHLTAMIGNEPVTLPPEWLGRMLVALETGSGVVNVSLEDKDGLIPKFELRLVAESTVKLGGFPENQPVDNVTIWHGSTRIDLQSPATRLVPFVTINETVAGVLYHAGADSFDIGQNAGPTFGNGTYRSGPNLTVTVRAGAPLIPQSEFLAQSVEFHGDGTVPVTFGYEILSPAIYTFKDFSFVNLSVAQPPVGGCFQVNMSGLVLSNAPVIGDGGPICLSTDHLESDVKSLPVGNIPVHVSGSCRISDNINKVVLGPTLVYITAGAGSAAPIAAPSTFSVNTTASSVLLSLTDHTVPLFTLMVVNPATITFDSSWYEVVNAENVTIQLMVPETSHLETDLIAPPRVVVNGPDGSPSTVAWTVAEPVYTAALGFYIFAGILGLILIISLVLCCMGACLKPEEEIDVSSGSAKKEKHHTKKDGTPKKKKKGDKHKRKGKDGVPHEHKKEHKKKDHTKKPKPERIPEDGAK
jgi:hypothetical protein